MDNTWSSMFWCLEGPHERGECPETGLLWVRDGHLGPRLANHSPVLAGCGPMRSQGRVWAPLVSRAADHHHQKPLIPLLAGKIVKTQLSQISKHIIGFFCCPLPQYYQGDKSWYWDTWHMASKYCGYLATDTCRPQPARVPCATQRWGVGAQLSFLFPRLVLCILCCLLLEGWL